MEKDAFEERLSFQKLKMPVYLESLTLNEKNFRIPMSLAPNEQLLGANLRQTFSLLPFFAESPSFSTFPHFLFLGCPFPFSFDVPFLPLLSSNFFFAQQSKAFLSKLPGEMEVETEAAAEATATLELCA